MDVTSFKGTVAIHDAGVLRDHLQSLRQGDFGAFHLDHGLEEHLTILINKDLAFVYFFPDNEGRHPGFQSTGMSPIGLNESVWFEQDAPGGGFDIAPEFVVPVEVAYRAAEEYLCTPGMPSSIKWDDLGVG